jgi:hypothetical protein
VEGSLRWWLAVPLWLHQARHTLTVSTDNTVSGSVVLPWTQVLELTGQSVGDL